MNVRSRRWLAVFRGRIAFALVIAAVVLVSAVAAVPWREDAPPAQAPPRQLLLAVDGLSWEAFEHAKSLGLFTRFTSAGRLIAPYPSMSHPSWMEVMGTRRLFGMRGNVRTVEARWFDLEAMRVHDDPREVIARQAGRFNYMRAFDTFFDPLIEPLMYFPGRRLFDREIDETERDVLRDFSGTHYAAYVSGSDAMAHTHRDSLYSYLVRLDASIGRIIDSLTTRDSTIRVWMVSDHGNVGAFREGDRERYLTPVSLREAARRAGLTLRDTGTVTDSNEVAVVTIALASMMNAWFPDLSKRRAFAESALREQGVSLATWLEVTDTDRHITILARDGEARLRWHGDSIEYTVIRGNPLDIPREHWSGHTAPRWMHDSVARRLTVGGAWPDAPRRLIASAEKLVENAPDLIINLEDGYCADGDFGRVVRMVRTHGSLSARSSLGVIAGTAGHVPAYVRADEAMAVMQFDERTLFARTVATNAPDARDAIARARTSRQLATARTDHSIDAAFLARAQPIVLSMGYFPWDRLRDFAALLPGMLRSRGAASGEFASLGDVDLLTGLAGGVDPLLDLGDSLQAGSPEDAIADVRATVTSRKGLAPLAILLDAWTKRTGGSGSDAPGGVSEVIGARQFIMATWTVPAFLDAALMAPETDSVPDTRDLTFATRWIGGERARVQASPERLLWNSPLPARLLREVVAERQLLRSTGAGAMSVLYAPPLHDITVVLLPGIYTELFDHEIWERGLRSIRDNLGLRTMTVPLDGRCDATINGAHLLAFLRDDTRRRLERGHALPRYLLLGYSKGGIDATHALLADSVMAHDQVAALVTIASPHRGSPVAERVDLPAFVTEISTRVPLPGACRTQTASSSLSPQSRSEFWAQEGARVAERTRLFSVSLVSTMDAAHPWMKITKRVGAFDEENDGVVARSASRFPASVPAVDLGVFDGDHIAGRRASDFPQEAVLEGLVITLAELGALDAARDRSARQARLAWMDRRAPLLARDASAPEFASDLREAATLPGGSSGWTPAVTFRTFDSSMPGAREVARATPTLSPDGIAIRCDQRSMLAFRREYEFAYDGSNGGREGNLDDGFSIVADSGAASRRACRLATRGSAIKMTTVSLRFRPVDFPLLSMRVRVAENVTGVDPTAARRGANDAAFKLWLVLRDSRGGATGETRLFGYTWNAPDARGSMPVPGTFLEALSSRRSLVVKTLPEAWLVAIGDARDPGWQEIERDLVADLARAYPGVPPEALEVVAVTIQSDSDESRGRSLSLVDHLLIRPRPRVAAAPGH